VIDLTRVYRFTASHRLDSPALSAEANRAAYGKCNNPFGHGHDYRLEVTVRGAVDPETGRVAPLGPLDDHVRRAVLDRIHERDLNREVPEFAAAAPTTEALAGVVEGWLLQEWPVAAANLYRIRIFETRNNIFEIERI
jgi:6-pyruvoyltetrahydropterin/6-carboxytetrahydropterin synthase